MRNWYALCCALILIGCSSRETARNHSHYDIHLILDPAGQTLQVRCRMELRVPETSPDSILFYLHRQLQVKSVRGALKFHTFEPGEKSPVFYILTGAPLTVHPLQPLAPGQRIRLEFEYGGPMTEWPEFSANVLGPDWTELGLYCPWFPFNPEYGRFGFTLRVQCPDGYEVRSYGEAKRRGKTWFFRSDRPVRDIVTVAAPDLKTVENGEGSRKVFLHHVTLSDSTAETMTDDLLAMMNRFNEWFGSKDGHLGVIQSQRKMGGGYARDGLIVLGGLEDADFRNYREGYTRYFAHELSHLWWNMAPVDTWHDWMNEGFAEYSALLMVETIHGREAFEKRLARKIEAMESAPPVWNFDRNDISTPEKRAENEAVLYSRAPVLLHRLAGRMGRERFFTLCRLMVSESIGGTETLLEAVERISGMEASRFLESLLKES